jgi:hypothetical protein
MSVSETLHRLAVSGTLKKEQLPNHVHPNRAVPFFPFTRPHTTKMHATTTSDMASDRIVDKIAALPEGSTYFSLEFFPPKTQQVRGDHEGQ